MAKKTQAESIGQQKPFQLLRFFSIFSQTTLGIHGENPLL
jgi:hypothetical protein